MAYQSLYRKYRPQTFSDVIGQEHVVRTLQNAIAAGRIAHGYLFTGTRGTAKTTVARLLAKALNCLSSDRPVPEPCNACDACRAITQGSCIDVIEMDAASHRGVADIEEVRKAVGYGAMQFRYKVFIIDEAHQLSSDAKDAFLKTLEEPPPGVVFILATTEPQAIPITIRSRCQQFDFKRGSLNDITRRLKYVLDSEGVVAAPEAIHLVARGAEGSYRDSLSLLEQVLAFAPKQIRAADVEMVLGSLDAVQLARVTECVAKRDAPGALALAGEILDAGKEARTLLKTLAAHFRDLLLVSVGGPAAANELVPEEVERLQAQARSFTPQQLLKAIDLLNEVQGETRWNNQHRLLVELAFLKLMTLGDAPDQPLSTAPIVFSKPAPAATIPAPVIAPVAAPAPLKPEPPRSEPEEPEPVLEAALAQGSGYFAQDDTEDDEDDYVPVAAVPEVIAAKPVSSELNLFDDDEDEVDEVAPPPVVFEAEAEKEAPGLFDLEEPTPTPAAVTTPGPAPKALVETVEHDDALPPPPEEEFAPFVALDDLLDEAAAPAVTAPAPVPVVDVVEPEPTPEPASPQEPVATDPRITLDAVRRAWPQFLGQCERISMQTCVMMAAAQPVAVEGKTVVLSFTARMNYDMMNAPKKQEFVRKLLARVLDPDLETVPVRFLLDENVPPPPQRTIARQKVHQDPMARLDFLRPVVAPELPASAPAPWSPPVAAPTAPRREVSYPRSGEPAPPPDLATTLDPEVAAMARPGSRKALALSEPLVQDILSTFGGEVIEE